MKTLPNSDGTYTLVSRICNLCGRVETAPDNSQKPLYWHAGQVSLNTRCSACGMNALVVHESIRARVPRKEPKLEWKFPARRAGRHPKNWTPL